MTALLVDQEWPVEPSGGWQRLPTTFHRLSSGRVVVSNMAGEQLVLSSAEFDEFAWGPLTNVHLIRRLTARHLIRDRSDSLPLDLLAMKVRTRYQHLSDLTQLHIFVVTLRCDHSCHY